MKIFKESNNKEAERTWLSHTHSQISLCSWDIGHEVLVLKVKNGVQAWVPDLSPLNKKHLPPLSFYFQNLLIKNVCSSN